MFDIRFFKAGSEIKKKIIQGFFNSSQSEQLFSELEKNRSKRPSVFNVETTNICNMKCVMCPRTELMDRALKTMKKEDFVSILDQVIPHSEAELGEFWKFISDNYDIQCTEKSENSFYFYIVSKCLTLHGFGEPLLDKDLVGRVREAAAKKIPTYLSCVPANLTVERGLELMEAGLTVLKVSIDSLGDEAQKSIRGENNNFEKSYATILEILREKEKRGLKTIIAPTMIAFSSDKAALEMHKNFLKLWDGLDVFAYVKSQDNRWLYEKEEGLENKSHYEKQYCEFPWTSLTVMADGSVVPCPQDYNAEMSFGNIRNNTLEEIWNSDAYKEFRSWHLSGNFPAGQKCSTRCDQKKIFQYLGPGAGV